MLVTCKTALRCSTERHDSPDEMQEYREDLVTPGTEKNKCSVVPFLSNVYMCHNFTDSKVLSTSQKLVLSNFFFLSKSDCIFDKISFSHLHEFTSLLLTANNTAQFSSVLTRQPQTQKFKLPIRHKTTYSELLQPTHEQHPPPSVW